MSLPSSIINNSAPVESAVAVSPNDSENLPVVARGLYVGGGGNLSVTMPRGNTVSFLGVPGGSFFPVNVARVNATGTTATDIVALY